MTSSDSFNNRDSTTWAVAGQIFPVSFSDNSTNSVLAVGETVFTTGVLTQNDQSASFDAVTVFEQAGVVSDIPLHYLAVFSHL